MPFLKHTTILIEGKEVIGFRHLKLTQNIHTHNELEVHFPRDVFDVHDLEYEGTNSQHNIGKKIAIGIANVDKNAPGDELKFSGLITEVAVVRGENTEIGNIVILTAKSNDIISNDGPTYNSFESKSLSDIVKETCGSYGFKTNIAPTFKKVIEYKVQHNESSYDFVHRIAREYGQWFYYNEDTLYFGEPSDEEIKLTYNVDLIELKTTLAPKSHNYNYFSNNYIGDNIIEDKKPPNLEINNSNWVLAERAGKAIFKNEKNVWLNINSSEDKNEDTLELRGKSQREAITINEIQVSGVSTNQNVSTGKIIDADGEKYRVTHVFHSISYNGGYTNQFKGVGGSGKASPLTNVNDFPKSGSQIAVVVNNNDPDHMGRVRVTFAWQKDAGFMTPWIRLVVPHAGSDQGIQFFPEVGDQVIVGFEGGNPDYPYVIGSVYHKGQKQASTEGGEDNFAKAIKTKGGSTILFNDKDGEECITIKDKKNNEIIISGKDDNISITAGNNITLSAGADISITAGGDIKIEAGANLETKAAMKHENTSGTDFKIKAGTNASVNAQIGVELKGTATAKLEAPMVDINGTAMTNVKGGIVNLN